MKQSVTLLCLLAWTTGAPGTSRQSTETFGQWSTLVHVGSPINTPYNDTYAILSRDGLTMYLTSDRPGSVGGDDLWFATRESVDAPWGDPQNMSVLNTAAMDSLAVLSSDEHVMFFYSNRTDVDACGSGDIWMTRRRDRRSQGWEPPTNVGCVLNTTADETAPAFFENPQTGAVTLFYGRKPGVLGDFDIYASAVGEDGYFGEGALVQELSSPGRDTRISIRKDGLEAFITSDRAGGLHIWRSTRETLADLWSTPVALPYPVNTPAPAADGSPWLSRDGTTLYFFSTRTGGFGGRDIWYVVRKQNQD